MARIDEIADARAENYYIRMSGGVGSLRVGRQAGNEPLCLVSSLYVECGAVL